MGRLENKVAIITGAASGMGLSAVKLFVEEGAKVAALDLSIKTLNEKLGDLGENVLPIECDVASEEAWKNVIERTIEKFGKIDILINNAGIHSMNNIVTETVEGWHKVIDVNLTGVWLGTKHVVPAMIQNGGGSIVNCSSIAGMVSGMLADFGGAAYCASKGGVRSFTKHCAQHLAQHNIRVNSVHPGSVFTGMSGGLSREQLSGYYSKSAPLAPHTGDPIDVAYGYLYLASDESKFVTGAELAIDGGFTSN